MWNKTTWIKNEYLNIAPEMELAISWILTMVWTVQFRSGSTFSTDKSVSADVVLGTMGYASWQTVKKKIQLPKNSWKT